MYKNIEYLYVYIYLHVLFVLKWHDQEQWICYSCSLVMIKYYLEMPDDGWKTKTCSMVMFQ
jgi:hypothetical protein